MKRDDFKSLCFPDESSESHHKLHSSLTHPSISTNGLGKWVVFYVYEVYGITATE